MYKIILIIILTCVSEVSRAQVKPPLAIEEYPRGLQPAGRIELFDLGEIKRRKIDTVLIIYHPASWAEYNKTLNACTCPYNDTLDLYRFDSEGRIIQHSFFQQQGDYSTTFHYDTSGNIISREMFRRHGARKGISTNPYGKSDTTKSKVTVIRRKDGSDSVVTKIFFFKFVNGLDTAAISTERYNVKRQLIEIQSAVNKRNAREFDDDTRSSSYHFKYDYDDQGRLIFYRDLESDRYQKISYPFYGRLTEIVEVGTNEVKEREVRLINTHDGVVTITFGNSQVILTPYEKGSKLFKLRTMVSSGSIPLMEYHEIIYK